MATSIQAVSVRRATLHGASLRERSTAGRSAGRSQRMLTPDIVAQLAALLDRPNPTHFGEEIARCDCPRCIQIRAAGLVCVACGFHGEPIVLPCECRETRASNIAYCQERIAEIEGGRVPDENEFSLAYLRRGLAETLDSPDRMCRAYPNFRKRRAQKHHCGHGHRYCPTCGNDGDGQVAIEGEAMGALLRSIRSLLMREPLAC